MKYSIQELEDKTYSYRKRFLELFTTIGFGHVTSAYSWAEVAAVLYNEIMRLPDINGKDNDYDRMLISKGHGAGILFPIFEELGYFTKEEMDETVKIGGSNQKLRRLFYPGFDFYGGSLGMGLGMAAGLAKAAKVSGYNWMTYCIIGDAECYEGSIWEAVTFAGFQRLDNLVVIIDRNMLGCSDFTEHMLALNSMKDKWAAFNWEVSEINGQDIQAVYNALTFAKNNKNKKPHCIIANTKKGQGLDYLIDKPLMHGFMPKGNEIKKAFQLLK